MSRRSEEVRPGTGREAGLGHGASLEEVASIGKAVTVPCLLVIIRLTQQADSPYAVFSVCTVIYHLHSLCIG